MLPETSGVRRNSGTGPDFYLACVDEGAAPRAMLAARALRTMGSVELDASMRALKTQLKQAEKRGARIAVIVESASPRHVKWKDMSKREQVEVEDDRLLEYARGGSQKMREVGDG
ncbi:MAG: Anticodon binding domain [Candidatus Krumholzibacteriota bacterium]|nr:Anticodon binding domain [Candidatus Krumholzibacteriota bacterium]